MAQTANAYIKEVTVSIKRHAKLKDKEAKDEEAG